MDAIQNALNNGDGYSFAVDDKIIIKDRTKELKEL